MQSSFPSIPSEYRLFICVFSIVLVQIALAFQGFDVADDGFVLTFYQQIFNDPSSVEYNFNYYLGGVVGGLWHKYFGSFGVLGFRFLAILVNTATFLISYHILKKYMNQFFLLVGLSMALFIEDFGFLTFYHNQLTALIAVISIYFFHKALISERNSYYFIAGCIIAINVFTRIPNLTLFVFVFAIPFKYLIERKSIYNSIIPVFVFLLGSSTGFILIYLLLIYNEHLEVMTNALLSLFALGTDTENSHNSLKLVKVMINNNRDILSVISRLSCFLFLLFLYELKIVRKIKYAREFLYAVVFLVFAYSFAKRNMYMIYSFGYVAAAGLLYSKTISKEFKTLIFLGLMMQIFLPLGSGGGINTCGYISIWISLPLIFKLISDSEGSISEYYPISVLKSIILIIVCSYFTVRLYKVSKEAYFDEGSRFKKTYTINNKYTEGIFTTEKRAKVINEVLLNLNKYVEPNDYLFVYDSFPMLYYLTETRPYVCNPWVMIYDSKTFINKLEKANREIEGLPIIVQQKFSVIYRFEDPDPYYMREDKLNTGHYNSDRTKAMNKFISKNNYEVVWSNSRFNIYKSTKVN